MKPFHAFKRKVHLWKYSWALKYNWVVWAVELLFFVVVNIAHHEQVCTSRSRDYLRKQNSPAQ